ncbi:tRNA 2-thiouridine(34) synthase MnmA [Candidatus Babeliales bacterium]|nr:tRNA 2-thiouridine(34) synthase MnmA [Candidatus Babeliales bacterium]
MNKKTKIAFLISGGVDSSLALQLLHQENVEIKAFYLKIWLEDELSFLGNCPWKEDLSYIEPLCEKLNIPLEIVPFQKEYWDKIVKYVIAEIKKGNSPNPDMLCNPCIKFGAFHDHLDSSFDFIATGHYAQKKTFSDHSLLQSAKDSFKDQTYFLAQLSQKQLSEALFPIGHLTKQEVRQKALEFQLPAMNRKDSQGICFLGKISFNDFIRHHVGENPGNIIEHETGKILGRHKGFWFHTIGQRKGLGLSGGPWYVVGKNTDENIVYASKNYFELEQKRRACIVSHFSWIYKAPNKENLEVKFRHGEQRYKCTLEMIDNDEGKVLIDGQDQGIAPGQFAVFYDDDICLGSATIKKAL